MTDFVGIWFSLPANYLIAISQAMMNAIEFDEEGLPLDTEIKTSVKEKPESFSDSPQLCHDFDKDSPELCHVFDKDSPQLCHDFDKDHECSLNEFTWVPPGLTPALVYQYMRSLPETKIPYTGSVGDRYRTIQLLRQLPVQDCNVKYCHGLSDEEKKELSLFSERRQKEALGRGVVKSLQQYDQGLKCKECRGSLKSGDIGVFALRVSPDVLWHPRCFICHQCKELLVDLIYFAKDGLLYCGRHHSEIIKPRCVACDELIFTEECTEAEGQTWHMKHFTCIDCEMQLGGQRYVMRDGHPICCSCYDTSHAERCQTCQEVIGLNQGLMELNGYRWHANSSCFRCDTCHESLVGRRFMPKGDTLYCSLCTLIALNVLNKETEAAAAELKDLPHSEPHMENQENAKSSSVVAFSDLSLSNCLVDSETCNRCENGFGCKCTPGDEIALPEGWVDLACIGRNQLLLKEKENCFSQPCASDDCHLISCGREVDGLNLPFHQENLEIPKAKRQNSRFLQNGLTPEEMCSRVQDQESLHLSKEEELIDMYQSQSSPCFDYANEYANSVQSTTKETENSDIAYRNSQTRNFFVKKANSCAANGEMILDDISGSRMKKEKPSFSYSASKNHEQPRKSKKSVRFDPSTKGTRTPSPREESRRRLRQNYHVPTYSQDDWNIWDPLHRKEKTSGYSSDGAVSRSKRVGGYSSDIALYRSKHVSGYSSDGTRSVDRRSTRWPLDEKHGQRKNMEFLDREHSMLDFQELDGDDIEKCSTCSSSSDSSDFYERDNAYGISCVDEDFGTTTAGSESLSNLSSQRSRMIPSLQRVTFAPVGMSRKKKKHKKSNCVVS